jgi:ornithine decarboxylase
MARPPLPGPLAEQLTPFFALDRSQLLARCDEFARHFPGVRVHYAMKANSHPWVLETLAEAGCGFEVASMFELEVLATLGVASDRIIYGTAVKPTDHIGAAHHHGVDRLAFDSEQELQRIAAVAPGARVYARIAIDDRSSLFSMAHKFGARPDRVPALMSFAAGLGLVPYGLSFMVGSQARSTAPWTNALTQVGAVMDELAQQGCEIEALNIGGGYPERYASEPEAPTLSDIGAAVASGLDALPYRPRELLAEPGRALVARAMTLTTSVIARVERAEGTWLYLDAGAYNALGESLSSQGSVRYPVRRIEPVPSSRLEQFVLAGPTGDGLDVIDPAAALPAGTEAGDRLKFECVGAYNIGLSSPFNGFPPPPVRLCDQPGTTTPQQTEENPHSTRPRVG